MLSPVKGKKRPEDPVGQRGEREMKWKKKKNGKHHTEVEEGIEPLKVSLVGVVIQQV